MSTFVTNCRSRRLFNSHFRRRGKKQFGVVMNAFVFPISVSEVMRGVGGKTGKVMHAGSGE